MGRSRRGGTQAQAILSAVGPAGEHLEPASPRSGREAGVGGILLYSQQWGGPTCRDPATSAWEPVMTGGGHPRPGCGRFKGAAACPKSTWTQSNLDGHQRVLFKKTCYRLECPTCWPDAAARAGGRAADRVEGGRVAYGHPDPRHIAFSPPDTGPESWRHRFAACTTAEEWRGVEARFRRKVVAMASRAGMTGGLVVVHAWRCDQKDGGGERYHTGRRYLSPHAHVVGFGFLENAAAFHDRTGWVYANLEYVKDDEGDWRYRKKLGVRDVTATVSYLLGHVPVDGSAQVTYFGDLSTRRLVLDKERVVEEQLRCNDSCGEPLWAYPCDPLTGEIDWQYPKENEVWKRHRVRTYKRRARPTDNRESG